MVQVSEEIERKPLIDIPEIDVNTAEEFLKRVSGLKFEEELKMLKCSETRKKPQDFDHLLEELIEYVTIAIVFPI